MDGKGYVPQGVELAVGVAEGEMPEFDVPADGFKRRGAGPVLQGDTKPGLTASDSYSTNIIKMATSRPYIAVASARAHPRSSRHSLD